MVWGRLLLLMFFLCTLQAALSLDPLYEGWVTDAQSKETLSFQIGTTSVYVEGNGTGVPILFRSCDRVNAYYVCIDNLSLSTSPKQVYARIFTYAYDFTITRTLNDTVGWYNRFVEVNVNITNKGSIDAPSFLYTDIFPAGLQVYVNQTASQAEQTYTYRGNISKNGTLMLRYYLKPIGPLSATLRSELFVDGLTFYSNLASLTTVSPINMSLLRTPHPATIGETVNLTFFVQHSVNASALVNATVRLPQSLQYLDGSRSKMFFFNFTDNRTLNRTFEAIAIYEGNQPLSLTGIVDNGLVFLLDEVLVSTQVLAPSLLWDAQMRETAVGGTLEPLYLALVNQKHTIKGLSVTLDSALFSKTDFFFNEVKPQERLILLNEDLLLPLVSTATKYPVNATYYYVTSYGELIKKEWSFNITLGSSSNLSVQYELDGTLKGGEFVDVTVKLANAIDAPLSGISIHDELDPRIFFSGTNANVLSLAAKETKTAYTYRIKLPYVFEDTVYTITSTVSYVQGEVPISFDTSKSIIVRPKEETASTFSLTATLTPKALSNTSIGTTVPVSLKLENKESISFKNIIVSFPLSSSYEVVGEPEVLLDRLDPSESVSLDAVFFVRPFAAGTFDLGPAKVYALDDAGRWFSGESTDPGSFEVSSERESGPLLWVNHSRVSFVENGAVYALTLENQGTSALDVTFNYNRQRERLPLAAKQKKEVKYTVFFPANGNYSVPSILAQYDYEGKGHRVYAAGDSVAFADYVAPKQQVILSPVSILEPSDKEVETSGQVVLESSSSLFSRSSLIITLIIFAVILVIIILYEVRKHKL